MRPLLVLSLILSTALLGAPGAAAGPLDCALEGVDDRCERWTAAHSGPANGTQFIDEHVRDVTFSEDGESVFVVGTKSRGGTIASDAWTVAYDPATGAERWATAVDADSSTARSVAADASRVYVTGAATSAGANRLLVAALDGATGETVWQAMLGDGAAEGRSVAVRDDLVVVGGRADGPAGGEVFVAGLDAATGGLLWSHRFPGTGPGSTGANAVAIDPDGRFAVAAGSRIGGGGAADHDFLTVVVDLTGAGPGHVRWVRSYDGGAAGTDVPFDLAIDGGRVFVTGPSQVPGGTLSDVEAATLAYEASTGRREWSTRYRAPGLPVSTGMRVVTAGDRVIVTGVQSGTTHANDSDVHALSLDPQTGALDWTTSYSGPGYSWEYPFAAATDGDRVYVSGLSSSNGHGTDFLTLALDVADGGREWIARYNSSPALVDGDVPAVAAVSPDAGTLVVSGQFTYLGPVSGLVPAGNDRDFGVVAYDL